MQKCKDPLTLTLALVTLALEANSGTVPQTGKGLNMTHTELEQELLSDTLAAMRALKEFSEERFAATGLSKPSLWSGADQWKWHILVARIRAAFLAGYSVSLESGKPDGEFTHKVIGSAPSGGFLPGTWKQLLQM